MSTTTSSTLPKKTTKVVRVIGGNPVAKPSSASSLKAAARAKFVKEFEVTDANKDYLLEQLTEAQYTVRRDQDGQRRTNNQWRRNLTTFWAALNGDFPLSAEAQSFLKEPTTKADIKHTIQQSLERLGYRCYFRDLPAGNDRNGRYHEAAMMVHIIVS